MKPAKPLTDQLTVSLYLRRDTHDNGMTLKEYADAIVNGEISDTLSHEEFTYQFGTVSADINAVLAFAQTNNLTVVESNTGAALVKLSGTVEQFNTLFRIVLHSDTDKNNRTYTTYSGNLIIPTEIDSIVEHVVGLNETAWYKPHLAVASPESSPGGKVPLTPLQVATAYNFPASTGAGQCIGIIELGGGYLTSDVQTSFNAVGLSAPTIIDVSVDGGTNSFWADPPTNTIVNGASNEVMLDIFVAGAVAPSATLAIYFSINTTQGFIDAISAAINDSINRPSVVSISWAGPEWFVTAQDLAAYDTVLNQAVVKGITVCVSSGDTGAANLSIFGNNYPQGWIPLSVNFPSSHPLVLSCGGTSLQIDGSGNISNETVWNNPAIVGVSPFSGSGGGISRKYAVPVYQNGIQYTEYNNGNQSPVTLTSGAFDAINFIGRGIPDISGNADPGSGYIFYVNGQRVQFGGTSAVSPLWAGLIARINALTGSNIGFVHNKLYNNLGSFYDVISGNNAIAPTKVDLSTSLGNSINPPTVIQGTTVTASATVYNVPGSLGGFLEVLQNIAPGPYVNSASVQGSTWPLTASVNLNILGTGEIYASFYPIAGAALEPNKLMIFRANPANITTEKCSTGITLTSNNTITWYPPNTPVVPIGSVITISDTIFNSLGDAVYFYRAGPDGNVIKIIDGQTANSDPYNLSTTVTADQYGLWQFGITLENVNSNGQLTVNIDDIINVYVLPPDIINSVLAPGAPATQGYSATTGWDAATGLGSPNGVSLVNLFSPATGALLSNLTISNGTLTPSFAANTTSYTDSVDYGTSFVTVTPTTNNPNTTITVNNIPVVSGSHSGNIGLNVGSNTITVSVTAH